MDQHPTVHHHAVIRLQSPTNLAERLTAHQHQAHDLVVSTMHLHLDHDDCLETLFLRGFTPQIRNFAEKVAAETGVWHSALNLIPIPHAFSSPQLGKSVVFAGFQYAAGKSANVRSMNYLFIVIHNKA